MKKFILCLCAVALFFTGYGQAGTLDTSFGSNGTYTPSVAFRPASCVLQANEKIVLTGSQQNLLGESRFFVSRYLADGAVDATFGTNGVSYMFPALSAEVYAVTSVVQADDKIVLAGITSGNNQQVTVARFNADGSVDSGFAGVGNTFISIPGNTYSVAAVKVLPDGKIIVAGGAGLPNTGLKPYLLQLMPDGSLNNAYGINGVHVINDLGFEAFVSDMAVQPDGKAVAVLDHINMATISNFYVMRFNLDGSRDNTFGSNGLATTSFQGSSSSKGVMIQSDGKIVAGGMYAYTGNILQLALARYLADGTADLTFGVDGQVLAFQAFTVIPDKIGIAEQANHQLVVAACGKAAINALQDFLISRFNPDGSADNGFADIGHVLTNIGNMRSYARSAHVLSSGKILATGISLDAAQNIYAVMARYNACGANITTQPQNTTALVGTDAELPIAVTAGTATFQWQKENNAVWESLTEGGQYSGTQTASLHISNLTQQNDMEQYRCLVFTGNCTDTSAVAMLMVTPLSIAETLTSSGFRISPNPAQDHINITQKAFAKNEDYIITDPLGHKWLQGTLSDANSTINITTLAAGIYFFTWGTKATYRFVKD